VPITHTHSRKDDEFDLYHVSGVKKFLSAKNSGFEMIDLRSKKQLIKYESDDFSLMQRSFQLNLDSIKYRLADH
jgi:hypothetical protein